ncbi:hypothetical protein CRE_22171 [Caenorhabditis remanei]|uniref:Galectin n=1 Tax=Caenorhabditis remanei TaxID=31234 RepID=E3NKW6_CAERE|nr:hypothetical protein CRE_22171 [Caenorhabditis remanei]
MSLTLLLLLLPSISICYNPPLSENVKMVVVYGKPLEFCANPEKSEENWANCLQQCWKQWDCVVVSQLSDGCEYFKIQEIQKVLKLDSSSGHKVGIKISLPTNTCPRDTEPPPLFGNVSSSLIITDGSDNYYKSEITETSDTWNFNYSMLKCLTDIPESYTLLNGTYSGQRYQMNLTSPFYPGETFFMRGKTPTYGNQFTISFVKFPEKDFALHIRLYFGYKSLNTTDISVWKNDKVVDLVNDKVNPYGCEEDFVIRINATNTVVFIYMNDYPVLQYTLEPTVPMSEITNIVINDSGHSYQQVTLYYIGWTGICEISLPTNTCPRGDTDPPPLFGNVSSSLIITDGSDNYYKSQITETSSSWDFNNCIHKCLTDIPENYDSLEGTYTGNRYQMNLTSPFYPGEMFFIKGKTPKYRNQVSISFVKFPEKDYALHIRLYFGYGNLNSTDITVWKNDVEVTERTVENQTNPYGCEEDFEIRINATNTVAYIYMNDYPVIQYTLEPTVPLWDITNFVINDSNLPDQQVTLYYIGWTGICEYVPLGANTI